MFDDVLDRNELMERVDNDQELLQELIELFVEDYPGLMKGIHDSIVQSDAEGLKVAAHTLKGAVGNFCAAAAFDAAFALEASGASGNLDNGSEQYALLEKEMDRVVAALQQLQSEGASAH